MTRGQIKLFRAIYEKQHPRIQFECYTQYGKSDVVSIAELLRASTFPEKWITLGATKAKAGIITGKLIKHIFENKYTLSKFTPDDNETLESIRRSRSKDNLTFKVDDSGALGQVLTLSADARRKTQDAGDILIGHGGQNLIEDDAALIPDGIHGKALRMLGGHAGNDFLLKITNSFGRNHAWRSATESDNLYGTGKQISEMMATPLFKRIVIDFRQGLEEGRLTNEYIDEMRNALDPIMFGILYECVYPPSDMVDEQGWMALITPEEVEAAQSRPLESKGYKRLGVDVSEGTNFNAFVLRTDNVARIREKNVEKDTMKTADKTNVIMNEERIYDLNTFIDANGIGAGVFHRLKQMGRNVNGVKTGEKPSERTEAEKSMNPIEFSNLRAEINWKMREWIRHGGALEPHKDWLQLSKLRYREGPTGKIEIMPKKEMHARGLLGMSESTDVPDALALTFGPTEFRFMTPPKASPLVVDPYEAITNVIDELPSNTKTFGGASPLPTP